MAMPWIHTSLEMSFGGEDGGEDIAIRLRGHYGPATPAILYGPMAGPAQPESFDVSEVEWQSPHRPADDPRWEPLPPILWTVKLERQLQAIGIAAKGGEDEPMHAPVRQPIRHAAE